jgi:hypothetical protein
MAKANFIFLLTTCLWLVGPQVACSQINSVGVFYGGGYYPNRAMPSEAVGLDRTMTSGNVWGATVERYQSDRWSQVGSLVYNSNYADLVGFKQDTFLLQSSIYHANWRGQFYYDRSGNWEWYSGLGLGLSLVEGRFHQTDSVNAPVVHFHKTLPSLDVVFIGTKRMLGQHWWLNAELGTANSFFRFGLGYRITSTPRRIGYRGGKHYSSQLEQINDTTYQQVSKGQQLIVLQTGYTFSNILGDAVLPMSINLRWEKAFRDNLTWGTAFSYFQGTTYWDEVLSLTHGWGPSRVLGGYPPSMLSNVVLTARITKYLPVGPRFMFYGGAGLGVRARILPNMELSTASDFIQPFSMQLFGGCKIHLGSRYHLSLETGMIPSVLQVGGSMAF